MQESLSAAYGYIPTVCMLPRSMVVCCGGSQPEAQSGFRPQRRVEEHLLTASTLIDKSLLANIPTWIISLDLSKASDRVNWDALQQALHDNGVSDHRIWIRQCLYRPQEGEVRGAGESSCSFCTNSESDKLVFSAWFCAVLQYCRRHSRVYYLLHRTSTGELLVWRQSAWS